MKDIAKIVWMMVVVTFGMTAVVACKAAKAHEQMRDGYWRAVRDSIERVIGEYPCEAGVALIVNSKDTEVVNDRNVYPMMSVFKVHQALALCREFDAKGLSLDSVISMRRDELDAKTWSPMLKEHAEAVISLPVKEMLRYTLTLSDNNASNVMFERLVSVARTDSIIATMIPRLSFNIELTEKEMSEDHERAYCNKTTPLGAAILMNRLFTDSLVSADKQAFITKTLTECKTGTDRIAAPLLGEPDVELGHKTGSGYTKADGTLVAHNDVGFVRLADGTHYALAVFVKDIKGSSAQASELISRISAIVYNVLRR